MLWMEAGEDDFISLSSISVSCYLPKRKRKTGVNIDRVTKRTFVTVTRNKKEKGSLWKPWKVVNIINKPAADWWYWVRESFGGLWQKAMLMFVLTAQGTGHKAERWCSIHTFYRTQSLCLTIGVSFAKVCRSLMLLLTSRRMFFTWELRFWLAAYAHSTPILTEDKHQHYELSVSMIHQVTCRSKISQRGRCRAVTHHQQ